MIRLPLAAVTTGLLLASNPGMAQPGVPVGPLPLPAPATGFDPARPPTSQYFNAGVPITGFIPGGSGFAPGNTISFSGPRGLAVPFNYGGYGLGQPYSPFGMYSYSPSNYGPYYAPYLLPFTTPIGSNDQAAPPLQGAGVGAATLKLTGQPAELSIQFPADATVWLNGREVSGDPSKSRDLSSPFLAPGSQYSFDVRAEWTIDGQTYQYENTVKVPSGERSKITVIAGTPKK